MLAVCYGVVVFTILVQGLSMPMLVRRLYPPSEPDPKGTSEARAG
jgi:CPA1 family monovalent cation:H+ antiporter